MFILIIREIKTVPKPKIVSSSRQWVRVAFQLTIFKVAFSCRFDASCAYRILEKTAFSTASEKIRGNLQVPGRFNSLGEGPNLCPLLVGTALLEVEFFRLAKAWLLGLESSYR